MKVSFIIATRLTRGSLPATHASKGAEIRFGKSQAIAKFMPNSSG